MRALRAAIYVRVSTDDQELAGQLRDVRAFVRRRGWREVATYKDQGESGTNPMRAGYRALMLAAALNRFDVVVVWAIDRFGRSLLELLRALEELESRKVAFASSREGHIDTTRPEGRLMLQLLASFAQFERERLSERTKIGIAAWRRRYGMKWGRPRSGPTLEEIRAELEKGKSRRRVAVDLGCSEGLIRLRLQEKSQRPAFPAQETRASTKMVDRKPGAQKTGGPNKGSRARPGARRRASWLRVK